jgi:hypothetical protein
VVELNGAGISQLNGAVVFGAGTRFRSVDAQRDYLIGSESEGRAQLERTRRSDAEQLVTGALIVIERRVL